MKALLEPFYTDFQSETERLIASFSDAEQAVIQEYLEKSLVLVEMTYANLNKEKI